MSNGRHRDDGADPGTPTGRWGRRLSRFGPVLLVLAVAAVVPPLVMPRQRPAPIVAPSGPAGTGVRPAAPSGSAGAGFAAITVHAADPANIRQGARVIPCGTCPGGRRVGYIGGPNLLSVRVAGITVAGPRTLTVVYEADAPRTLKIRVNDAPARTLTVAGAGSLVVPASLRLAIFLPAGTSWITFSNDAGSAPDINQVVVS